MTYIAFEYTEYFSLFCNVSGAENIDTADRNRTTISTF